MYKLSIYTLQWLACNLTFFHCQIVRGCFSVPARVFGPGGSQGDESDPTTGPKGGWFRFTKKEGCHVLHHGSKEFFPSKILWECLKYGCFFFVSLLLFWLCFVWFMCQIQADLDHQGSQQKCRDRTFCFEICPLSWPVVWSYLKMSKWASWNLSSYEQNNC